VGWIAAGGGVGEIDNPFATESERLAYYGGVPKKNTRSWMVNPFAESGATEFIVRELDGGALIWRAVPNQIIIDLSNPDGSPMIQETPCSGFSVGTLTEVYTSPILPDWMFEDGVKFSSFFEGGVRDPSNTNVYAFSAGPRSGNSSDVNDACHAGTAAASSSFKGSGQTHSNFRVFGRKIYGAAGTTAFGANAPVGRAIATITQNAQRIRFAVSAGAVTNLYYFGRYAMVSQ
jgi:hypothetical protein